MITIRHKYEPRGVPRCWRCGKAKSNVIHRVGSRCSVCFRFFKHYQLDASRRCDDDAP